MARKPPHKSRSLLVACCLGAMVALATPGTAYGLEFGPTVRAVGPEETVFDYSTDHCAADEWDTADQPARAFRDDRGQVQLFFTAMGARRNVGPDLGAATTHDCTVRSWSALDPDPSQYDQYAWISAPYTIDGHTVYSLSHQEYRAWEVFDSSGKPRCTYPDGDVLKCWYNAITLHVSTNGGDLFTHAPAPSHLVASVPSRWVDGTGPYGTFSPSNIIRKQPDDGYYYSIIRARERGKTLVSCLIRTDDLGDPGSWRAWGDGPDADTADSFEIQFVNPYTYSFSESDPASGHMCKNLGGWVTGTGESLTYNTYLDKYVLVGTAGGGAPGFHYLLSDDLIHWSDRKPIFARLTEPSYVCGDPDPVLYPSLLDPSSASRNFETTGRHPYLYYVIFHVEDGCNFGPDRDLLRIPLEFDPSTASSTVEPKPAVTGQAVSADASVSGAGLTQSSCRTIRRNRLARLRRSLRRARRNLARASTAAAKRRYRRQVRSVNKRLKRVRSTRCS